MNRPPPLVTLLERRTRALGRQLTAAIAGKDVGVHQARVASRRLREALPVLTKGLEHSKSGKAQRKIRRLTQALGTVRELDVTLHLIDELGERPGVPRAALAEVRALVIEDRERRRAVMLERLERVNTDKLGRRLGAVRQALMHPTPGHGVACTGTSIGEKGMMVAAKAIAASAIDLYRSPELIQRSREDLKRSMADQKYTTLIPEGQKAPKTIR